MLGLAGTLGADGEPLIDGRPWHHPTSAAAVREAAGAQARVARFEGPERFDVLPLLVATDGAIAALGEDGRRLRPNIVLSGVPGLADRSWPGSALRIGDALVGVQSVRGRCIVTTIDPDTGAQDLDVLRKIHRQFGGTMALNRWVVRGAHIQVGNQVEVVDLDVDPPAAGGWISGAPYSVATSAATVRGLTTTGTGTGVMGVQNPRTSRGSASPPEENERSGCDTPENRGRRDLGQVTGC